MKERARSIHGVAIVLTVVGVLMTAGLVIAASSAHVDNEARLLRQRTREAASVLTAAVPSIQTPLASAAELIEATNGQDSAAFERLMTPQLKEGGPYISASIWAVDGDIQPVMVVGEQPKLALQSPAKIRDFLTRSATTTSLNVIGLLDGDKPRLGYAFTSLRQPPHFVAYAEAFLPPNRTSVTPNDSAFADLDYAVYLDDKVDAANLLVASTSHLPLASPAATEVVPFGDTQLMLVMRPTGQLGGRLMELLPWLAGAVGLIMTLGAAGLIERLSRSRDRAQRLAEANAGMFANQRSIAETLQQSLLPEALPTFAGIEVAAQYIPGDETIDIGGDWYDVISFGKNQAMLVVGDVSGRGIRAAGVMASLRFAARAFASQGDDPATLLDKLTNLLDIQRDGHFATVICAVADFDARTITISNAGHPPPMLIDRTGAHFLHAHVGAPIGARSGEPHSATTFDIPAEATLLLFTDGLFERRGETIDDGLERLSRAAGDANGSLAEVLTTIVARQGTHKAQDDTAVLGMRWLQ